MRVRLPEIVICALLLGSVAVICGLSHIVRILSNVVAFEDNWIIRLSLNLLGYSSIFIPGYIIFVYVKTSNYMDKAGPGFFPSVVKMCFTGLEPIIGVDGTSQPQASQQQRSTLQEAFLILFCFFGLQLTYLTWGLLQEKVMTQEYVDNNGLKSHFKDSQFLVFVNRILAFLFSGFYLVVSCDSRHTVPLYKYVYCSFSNIMSSWCQYEALKFVSFPTQVLAKASKIIPVMIMGKVISKKKYEYYEYVTASMISLGMVLFLSGSSEDKKESTVTTLSGIILLISYMACDSFTSNWQGALFTHYGMSSVQMMCGVNLFSCLFTAVSILQQNGFAHSFSFMAQFPKFIFDCVLLSVCSAAGQLFIFYTIAHFGPVVFVIMMTIRQGLAILLSCIFYEHYINVLGIIGIAIVFVSIFLRVYCNQRLRAIRKRTQISTSIKM